AVGSPDSTSANGRTASTMTPVTAPLHRVRAPAIRFSAERENDPPAGYPPNSPAPTFARPCPTNSRSGSHGVWSARAYRRAIEAGSAKPITPMTAAGTNSVGTASHGSARVSSGKPLGIAPTSGTSIEPNRVRTRPPTTATSAYGTTRLTSRPTDTSITVAAATSTATGFHSPMWPTACPAATNGFAASVATPPSDGTCEAMINTAAAAVNPETTGKDMR